MREHRNSYTVKYVASWFRCLYFIRWNVYNETSGEDAASSTVFSHLATSSAQMF